MGSKNHFYTDFSIFFKAASEIGIADVICINVRVTVQSMFYGCQKTAAGVVPLVS